MCMCIFTGVLQTVSSAYVIHSRVDLSNVSEVHCSRKQEQMNIEPGIFPLTDQYFRPLGHSWLTRIRIVKYILKTYTMSS